MTINLKNGVDKLLFGMKKHDVEKHYGSPDKEFKDDDDNLICLYFKQKLRLTFYTDEQCRLGYIITSNNNCTIFDEVIIGQSTAVVKSVLPFKSWEMESFDSTENHFNESSWLTLQSEFGVIIRIEIGAIIKDNDEFDWKFK